MSLRTRLLLAIGYVLLIAIVAFEVPLALTTSERIDSEVKAQAAAQADLLAVAAAEHVEALCARGAEAVGVVGRWPLEGVQLVGVHGLNRLP